ncbi:MAG TPA: hypothetical protein PKV71_03610 [Calditrichia bacterium]|nr:hypothetical protein [Calditrichota bacterium]HQU73562.1 hypothetical protein [Calditrichia bacterium]HQV30933.1 hypothetical protein [Calditrichia bacterium]
MKEKFFPPARRKTAVKVPENTAGWRGETNNAIIQRFSTEKVPGGFLEQASPWRDIFPVDYVYAEGFPAKVLFVCLAKSCDNAIVAENGRSL